MHTVNSCLTYGPGLFTCKVQRIQRLIHLRDEFGGEVAVEGLGAALAADAAVLDAAEGRLRQRLAEMVDVDDAGREAVLQRQRALGSTS